MIQDIQKYDAIRLICKRLLTSTTHHELLIYEALLSLTNISSCLQANSDFAEEIAKLPCGQDKNLYSLLAKDLLFEKNDKIKLAAAELLSNLSLSKTVQKIVEDGDFEPKFMI